jgi:transposase
MKQAQKSQEKEAEVASLRAEVSTQKQTISEKDQTISALEEQVMFMQARIAWHDRQRFGQKSEKYTLEDPNQLCLDFDLEQKKPEPEAEPEKEAITYTRKKKHPGRKPLPEDLPRKEILIEPKGKTEDMVRIGEEVTEKLAHVPAQLFVLRYVRPKYVRKDHDGTSAPLNTSVAIADLPEFVLPKSIADASLLAAIIIAKYVDHLPLYRQLAIYRRAGIELAESTIGNWVDQSAKLLEPLYDALAKSVTSVSGYVQADESTIQVLDSKKKGKSHRGYMWLYLDPKDKLVLFDYQHGRAHRHVKEILADFQGIVQSDGYEAYDYFDNKPGIIHLHCMAHARRKFFDAKSNDPPRAAYFLSEVQKLYKIEADLREQNADYDMRMLVRQTEATPILKKMGQWLKDEYPKVLPKSSIGKAIAYSLKRWNTLSEYVHHGIAEIDNNLVENQVRPLALGRKNYLFAGSARGAKNTAIFYSLIASAKLNGLNPFHYLYTVLRRLPTQAINRIDELLPYNFQPADLEAGPQAKIAIEE